MDRLQQQAGSALRADVAHVVGLAGEHGVLSRELGRVQERCSRVIAEQSAEIERLKAHTGLQRVAQFLADLTDLEQGSCEVNLPYNKRLIAGNLGMQPESLSRAFARLREHGGNITRLAEAIGLERSYLHRKLKGYGISSE